VRDPAAPGVPPPNPSRSILVPIDRVTVICFHVIEKLISGVLAGKSVAESVPAIGGGFVGLVCVAVMLFVALIPFFAFKHVARELGQGRLNAMLFGTPIHEAGR